MINVTGRTLHMTQSERNIGFVNDNNAETRKFLIADKSLCGLCFKLDIQNTGDIVELAKTLSDDGESAVLTWLVGAGSLIEPGNLIVQLRAFDENSDLVWHSEKTFFRVGSSVGAVREYAGVLPSEFEQLEKEVTAAKNAAKASEKAAKLSENAAKVSEDKAEQYALSLDGAAQEVLSQLNELCGKLDSKANSADVENALLQKADVSAANIGEEVWREKLLGISYDSASAMPVVLIGDFFDGSGNRTYVEQLPVEISEGKALLVRCLGADGNILKSCAGAVHRDADGNLVICASKDLSLYYSDSSTSFYSQFPAGLCGSLAVYTAVTDSTFLATKDYVESYFGNMLGGEY